MQLTNVLLKSPQNLAVAQYLGLTEGAIRAQKKKKDNTEYIKSINKYNIATQPFIDIELYAETNNLDLKNLIKDSHDGKTPALLQSKKEDKILVPYCLKESEDLKQDFKEFNKAITISIANTSGGAGKTTNSIAISTFLSFLGYDVLFVDFDTQSNASQRFDLRPDLNFDNSIVDLIIEVGQGTENSKELVKNSIISMKKKLNTIGKFDVLPNSGQYKNANKLNSIENKLRLYGTAFKSLDMTLDIVKDNYDFIIIDTPPSIGTPLSIAALATDYFILSYRPEDKAIAGVPMLLSKLKEELEPVYKMNKNKNISILGGIITDFDSQLNMQKDNVQTIKEDFEKYIKKFNYNHNWKIFDNEIKQISRFEEIKVGKGYGTLISPESLSEPISKNVCSAIKDYLTITNDMIERIIIDMYENQDKDK